MVLVSSIVSLCWGAGALIYTGLDGYSKAKREHEYCTFASSVSKDTTTLFLERHTDNKARGDTCRNANKSNRFHCPHSCNLFVNVSTGAPAPPYCTGIIDSLPCRVPEGGVEAGQPLFSTVENALRRLHGSLLHNHPALRELNQSHQLVPLAPNSAVLEALKGGTNVTLITLGGSPSAGGDLPHAEVETFTAVIAQYLEAALSHVHGSGRVNALNMAHGDTDALFAAMHAQSLFPLADLNPAEPIVVIFVFSVNNHICCGARYTLPEDMAFKAKMLLHSVKTQLLEEAKHRSSITVLGVYLHDYHFGPSEKSCDNMESIRTSALKAEIPVLLLENAQSAINGLYPRLFQVGAVEVNSVFCAENIWCPEAHPVAQGHEAIASIILNDLIQSWLPPGGGAAAPSAAVSMSYTSSQPFLHNSSALISNCGGGFAVQELLIMLKSGSIDSFLYSPPHFSGDLELVNDVNIKYTEKRFTISVGGRRDSQVGVIIPSCRSNGTLKLRIRGRHGSSKYFKQRLAGLIWYPSKTKFQETAKPLIPLQVRLAGEILRSDSIFSTNEPNNHKPCGISRPKQFWHFVPRLPPNLSEACSKSGCEWSMCVLTEEGAPSAFALAQALAIFVD